MTSAEWVVSQQAEYVVPPDLRTTVLLHFLDLLRNLDVGSHNRRVGSTALRLAHQLPLEPEWRAALHQAAPNHDIGKLSLPGLQHFSPTMSYRQKLAHVSHIPAIAHRRGLILSRNAIQLIENHHPYRASTLDGQGRLAVTPLVAADIIEAVKEPRVYRQDGMVPVALWPGILESEINKFQPSLPLERLDLSAELKRGKLIEATGGLLFPTAIANAALKVMAALEFEL